MIGRWLREARRWAVVALAVLAVVLPSATADAAVRAFDMPAVVRVDVHRHHTDEAQTGHLGDVLWPPSSHERSASPPARAHGPSTPFALRSVATEAVPNGPTFIAHPNGEVVPVPSGATGPTVVESGKGFQFTDGSGGPGLDPRVTDVRVMDPVTGGKYPYPYG